MVPKRSGGMIGGLILILCSLLAAPPAPAQQPDEQAQTARQDTILLRISALESRIDSLLTELSSLKEAVAAAGISAGPGVAEEADEVAVAAPEPDELEQLRAAARREIEAEGAAREEPEETQKSRTRNLRLLNPEITVSGDVVGSILAPSGGEARATAVPREFEFGFQATLDPFARTAIFLAREEELRIAGLSDEEEGGEEEGGSWVTLEEGYVDWIALPAGMSVKLGKYRPELGLYNRWHTHALLEVDRPLPVLSFLGDDGLLQTGVSVALPLLQAGPLTQSTWLDVAAGTNELLFDGGSQPSFVGRTQSFFDLGPASYLQFGVDGVVGRNSDVDLNSSLVSVDVAYRWTPPARALYQDLQLKAEWYFARRNEDGLVSHGNGGYGQAHYKFARQWQVGFRADYLNPYGQTPDVWQFVPSVSWWQSEWVRLRLQGNIVRRVGESTNFTLFFQTTWAVGPHKHATY